MRMPALFISHGAPTFAIEPGLAGAQLNALGRALEKPRAVVIVSPHWMTRGIQVGAAARPGTIHDFGGFPAALYQLGYPAPGAPELAQRIVDLFAQAQVAASLNEHQGLDHGAWVPLMHLYPDADVPVVQVSMPAGLDPIGSFELGRVLAPLADEGVLIVGSGSLTHNLYEFRGGTVDEAPYAREFTGWIRAAVLAGDREALLHALERAPHASRAHPTAEHFLPLLVALGAAPDSVPVTVLDGGIRHGVLAMESYAFGRQVELNTAEVRQ
ncbi:MAG: dioxygenase [Proteobacteria bacterium]|nr:dioxygenase [Pseudomonadota bacterium]